MRFGDAAELRFPAAVENDPVDAASPPVGFVPVGFRCGELHVAGGPARVVRVEHRLDRVLADEAAGDGGGELLAGEVAELLEEQLCGVGTALAIETAVAPFAGNALEPAEQVNPRLVAGVMDRRSRTISWTRWNGTRIASASRA